MHFYALKPRNGKKVNLSYAFNPKILGISSVVSKFTMHPFNCRKALKIMSEDIDAKFSALKERLEEKREKFVSKLETFVKVSKNGKRWSFLLRRKTKTTF